MDNETRSLDQLPRLAAVSPEALALVQEPGGVAGAVEVRRLLGRLISTQEATATQAILAASLDYPANALALVFADPNPELNGWYRKTGQAGNGGWMQFEQLSAFAMAKLARVADTVLKPAIAGASAATAEASAAIVQASSARDESLHAKAFVEAALAALTAGNQLFATVEDGLAATANGQSFVVRGDGLTSYARLFDNVGGAAVPGPVFPALARVESLGRSAAFSRPVIREITALPPVAAEGSRFLVAFAGASGDLVGKESQIAERTGGEWIFSGLPESGARLTIEDEGRIVMYGPIAGVGFKWVTQDYALVGVDDALEGLSTDAITRGVQAASARLAQSVSLPPNTRRFQGSVPDLFGPAGIRLEGSGNIIEMGPDSSDYGQWRLWGGYGDRLGFVVGRQYLLNMRAVLLAGLPLFQDIVGDSTGNGFGVNFEDFKPYRLLEDMAVRNGYGASNCANHCINGSSAGTMPLDAIRPGAHIVWANYGINDAGVADPVATYYHHMDAKCAEFRQRYPYGKPVTDGSRKDLVILGPNSVNHWAVGAGPYTLERFRAANEMLAHKHYACYLDKYGWASDCFGGEAYMDVQYFEGPDKPPSYVHPDHIGNGMLWALIEQEVFRAWAGPGKSNLFLNRSGIPGVPGVPGITVDLPPGSFTGLTLDRSTGAGWPVDGMVESKRQIDGIVCQQVTAFDQTCGTPRVACRVSNGPDTWGAWSNYWTILEPKNGWTVPLGVLGQIRVNPWGEARLRGWVEGGAKASGTVLFTVPEKMRPPQNLFLRALANVDGEIVPLLVDAESGDVKLFASTTANTLRLDGESWVVAGM